MQETKMRAGAIAALSACGIWGILPIYWKLLDEASAYEILAQRICWAAVFVMVLLIATKRLPLFYQETKRILKSRQRTCLLLAAAVLISANWAIYIWAVNSGHIVETSIGYYTNPLMSVMLGMFVFKERLVLGQKISLVLAGLGIANMIVQFGAFPWVSMGLAVSFALYGAVKKVLRIDPIIGICLETLLTLPFAFLYVVQLASLGQSHFGQEQWGLTALLIGSGVVTAVPLLLFSRGINLLPLNLVGFLGYISPTIALLIGVLVYHEPFGWQQMGTFGFIWLALLIFSLSNRFAVKKAST